MFLTVYLSNNEQHFSEVPVTPDTTCRDVVELCKEPGETDCHLSEVWRGTGMYPLYDWPNIGVAENHGSVVVYCFLEIVQAIRNIVHLDVSLSNVAIDGQMSRRHNW